MSKRFKGEQCVYCSTRPSFTGDHVFARQFFLESDRANLPQAPICKECNDEKSKLEHYLTVLLPFGGRHRQAVENLTSMVPKRLQRNVKLHRQLAESKLDHAIPLEGDKLEELFALIARGLIWHHWRVYLDDEQHAIHTAMLTPKGTRLYDELLFTREARDRVAVSVGGGTFRYEGLQGTDDPALTGWRFSIYGGLTVSEGDAGKPLAAQLVVVTGPRALVQQFDQFTHKRVRHV
jgi:hypothetical protein